jgi:hypothetical protein
LLLLLLLLLTTATTRPSSSCASIPMPTRVLSGFSLKKQRQQQQLQQASYDNCSLGSIQLLLAGL